MVAVARPIVVSAGEPAGIGPDLIIQLAQQPDRAPWFVAASPQLLQERARQLGLTINVHLLDGPSDTPQTQAQHLSVFPIPLAQSVTAGILNMHNSAYVLECIRAAAEFCLRGVCCGMVTAPVHKGIINDAGIRFTGHTEWLADYCGVDEVVMMLAHEHYRVALATTHLPLHAVSNHITPALLERKLTIMREALTKHFAIAHPHIALCGLNPHAGEQGHLGREEQEVIAPTIAKLQQQGFNLSGPFPADTLLAPRFATQYDAVMAMYHDQGLGAIKACYFDEAVNITLGLPFLRTSVDHGTALSLAGTGTASCTSLNAAIAQHVH